ncbi:MAG TPA: peptidoglycan-binding protein [Bryobacteraceae bacterium]|nr:peptidoglycan-binding protein [Bryobacteraceae bacterium]
MKSACFLFLISVLAASVALPQAATPPAQKAPPKAATKTATPQKAEPKAAPKAEPKAESKAAPKAAPKAAGTTAAATKKAPATKTGTATKKTYKSAKKNGPPAQTWRNRQLAPTASRYKEIQQALADKGYLKTEPNGVWDAQSEEALKRFQTDRNLPPTGKITSQSLIGLGLGPKPPEPITAPPQPDTPPPATNP